MQQHGWKIAGLLAALVAAGQVAAQVTPAEPFGGRPFGAPAGAAAPQRAPQPVQQQPGVVVQPGAAPVVVQNAPAPVVVQAPPAESGVGPITRPGSSVNPQGPNAPPGVPQNVAPQPPATVPAQPQAAAPQPPAPVTPPFAANRPGATPPPGASQQQAQPVRGLPPDAPRLVISGSVWSANPAQRRLIVNGQPVREGDDVGPGVVVQEVQREGAVLGFRGNRYNVFF